MTTAVISALVLFPVAATGPAVGLAAEFAAGPAINPAASPAAVIVDVVLLSPRLGDTESEAPPPLVQQQWSDLPVPWSVLWPVGLAVVPPLVYLVCFRLR